MKTIEELEKEIALLKHEIYSIRYLLDQKQDKDNYEEEDDSDDLSEEDIEERNYEEAIQTVSDCRCGAYCLTKSGKLLQVSDCVC